MSQNDPGRSRKVLEASGRFQKVSGSTTHYPTPLALGASHLGCPKSAKGWGHHKGAILLQVGLQSSLEEDSPVGRSPFGRRSPKGTPPPPIAPKGPPGHLYKEGQGWGAQQHQTPSPMRLPPSL